MAISQAPPLLLILLVSLFVLPALGSLTKFGNCDSTHQYPTTVSSVDISPFPVRRFKDANFTITGSTRKAIPGGASVELIFVVLTQYDKFLDTKSYSLCDITACPVLPGPFVLTFTNVMKHWEHEHLPYYVVDLKIMEKNVKEPIMCIGFYIYGGFTGYVSEISQVFTG
ncbi:MD-2-related lipid-recognition protein ROSY1 [Eutrema salsugineum]|uniref:MD-2-related lipid-recognition protein ROSY1 n=1 Tax=Eutrema salsugineum TaxID=72664 RepID=UPI000CECEEC3|nr:MD-2-related lipid-recognition protein ROSY1 [Eutrema salsugineum]